MTLEYVKTGYSASILAANAQRFWQSRAFTLGMILLTFLVAFHFPQIAFARDKRAQKAEDLASLSLEELMNIEVTSVSKREERLFEAPAAIFVITPEDIRRSGATSLPELFRMVPGMHVARISANKWAISARGFNNEFANKLLVLIDGRSVYTPLFGGVFWDIQDVPLEDIERIEVIRGPGASLWGANAVNGVINIVTKKARDTQGGMITAGAGNDERGFGSARYGGTLGKTVSYRVYAKYFDRSSLVNQAGKDSGDHWNMLRGGFRFDWNISGVDSLTIQGDSYGGNVGEALTFSLPGPPFSETVDEHERAAGGNVLSRWNRVFSEQSSMSLQFYYDRTRRKSMLYEEARNTFDLDLQHDFSLGARHHVVWGLGWRTSGDDIVSSFTASADPAQRTFNLFNGFVHDEFTLVKNRLRLTAGSKVERNSYTGAEVQPNVRLMWMPHQRGVVWGAVSFAHRTPSRADEDIRSNLAVFPGQDGLITYVTLFGNPASKAERLTAYEIGYKVRPTERLFLQISAFHNVYRDLSFPSSLTPFLETKPSPVHLVIPLRSDNSGAESTSGVEASADLAATKQWRLAASYTWTEVTSAHFPASAIPVLKLLSGDYPRNQFQLHSFLNLRSNLEFDTALYYVDRLPALGVPRYARVDARLGWRPAERLELSLSGQNLFDHKHTEFGSPFFAQGALPAQIERSISGKVTWRF
jgi:iron complex outermembrane receptor protein